MLFQSAGLQASTCATYQRSGDILLLMQLSRSCMLSSIAGSTWEMLSCMVYRIKQLQRLQKVQKWAARLASWCAKIRSRDTDPEKTCTGYKQKHEFSVRSCCLCTVVWMPALQHTWPTYWASKQLSETCAAAPINRSLFHSQKRSKAQLKGGGGEGRGNHTFSIAALRICNNLPRNIIQYPCQNFNQNAPFFLKSLLYGAMSNNRWNGTLSI